MDKHYTAIVPKEIYEELTRKGMPVLLETYAQVFDWLLTQGQCINITPDKLRFNFADLWRYTCFGKRNYVSAFASDWFHTANRAIQTALSEI